MARAAGALAVSWNIANNAVLTEGRRADRRSGPVTAIIDLTMVRDKTGPARQLGMIEGRSKKAFVDWFGAAAQGVA